jgi:hypothetical protein
MRQRQSVRGHRLQFLDAIRAESPPLARQMRKSHREICPAPCPARVSRMITTGIIPETPPPGIRVFRARRFLVFKRPKIIPEFGITRRLFEGESMAVDEFFGLRATDEACPHRRCRPREHWPAVDRRSLHGSAVAGPPRSTPRLLQGPAGCTGEARAGVEKAVRDLHRTGWRQSPSAPEKD